MRGFYENHEQLLVWLSVLPSGLVIGHRFFFPDREEGRIVQFAGYLSIATIFIYLGLLLRTLFLFLTDTLGLKVAQIIVAIVVIGLGVAAHKFKRRNQRLYGVCEIIFGSTSAIGIASGLSSTGVLFSRWAALAGCVYVVARGLNNCTEAREKAMAKLAENYDPAVPFLD
jgi:predicted membrane channel-forming protein YqfA (hemolysin III family)